MTVDYFYRLTRFVFIGCKLLLSPLEAMFGLLVFIFVKDLNATPFQITLLVCSKPLVALISFYTNVFIKGRPERLKTMMIWSVFLGSVPCLFFPFINNIWFYLGAFALFMASLRAMIPPWAEIFKINLSQENRGLVFAHGSTTNYLISIVIPLCIAPWIDIYPTVWRWLFFGLGLLQLLNILLLTRLKIQSDQISSDSYPDYHLDSWKSLILGPWKNCLALMRNRPDFRSYQLVFMLGGGGLMLMHPILPLFFKETLHLSYTGLTLATSFCKGIAFALTSSLWARLLNRISIEAFNGYVTLFAGMFGLMIIFSESHIAWLYAAYLVYGFMQAGSELSWNLSGPIFSKNKDSTLYSGVNVAMVGLRGAIAPFLGELIFVQSNAAIGFACGAILCFMGSFYSFRQVLPEARLGLNKE